MTRADVKALKRSIRERDNQTATLEYELKKQRERAERAEAAVEALSAERDSAVKQAAAKAHAYMKRLGVDMEALQAAVPMKLAEGMSAVPAELRGLNGVDEATCKAWEQVAVLLAVLRRCGDADPAARPTFQELLGDALAAPTAATASRPRL